jgi:tetratricopeptide (TPR) repeat protein
MSVKRYLSKVSTIYYSYAPSDKKFRDMLEKHLSSLQRQGIIDSWHEGKIVAGSEREAVLKEYLDLSDIILLLISADFISSDYCYSTEMEQALQRHRRGEAHVIPILLRPTSTQGLPFAILQFLPTDGKPITHYKDRDDAFVQIIEAILTIIEEMGTRLPSEPAPIERAHASPTWWKVSYSRNTSFIGRHSILEHLHDAFLVHSTGIFVQSLNGMGGIGKTQIALEYAYRYRQTYQAIFWVTADSQGNLLADFATIAQFLDLPQKNEPNQDHIRDAIRQWFQEHTQWLLVLDNVDTITDVQAFLPSTGQGHILITTRAQATGTIAVPCEVEPMDSQEGTQLLLQRVKLSTQHLPPGQVANQEKAAQQIVQLFDGHPLALDQAGTYMEEAGLYPSDYLNLYQQRQAELLQYRGDTSIDHPDSVMTTFSLAFGRVEHTRPAAAELLRFCAFLHPDAIPDELLIVGALSFDPDSQEVAHDPLELNKALVVLRKYSLVKRNPTTKTINVHRLVQDVLRNSMEKEQQRRWSTSVMRTLSQEFPDGEPDSWPVCLRYLPHARVAIKWITTWQMRFIEAVNLLDHVGYYLDKRGEYAEAQTYYKQALALLSETEEPLLAAHIHSRLGVLSILTAQSFQAEQHLKNALALREQLLEPNHPDIAQNLNDLAGVYHNQKKLREAAPLYQQALTIQEQTLGAENPATIRTLSNLALLYYSQKNYAESEALNKRALTAREHLFGTQHPDTGQSLLNLAYVYKAQQKYTEAEPLFQRALSMYEQAYGPDHPLTANVLNGLGLLAIEQQRYAEAYGPDHPRFVGLLNAFATIACAHERYEEADRLLKRAAHIQEETSWLEDVNLIPNMRVVARGYEQQGEYERAEPLYHRMIGIQQRALGTDHAEVVIIQQEYASFLRRKEDAAQGNSDPD